MSGEPILRAEGFGKRFGEKVVLNSAGLWAYPGEVTGVVGRNGTGKTTLLRMIAGDLSCDHGSLQFAGRAHEAPRGHLLARDGLCFMPQDGLVVPFWRVRKHFQFMEMRFGPSPWEGHLEAFGLGGLIDRLGGLLSGGEKRAVSLALVLARGPRCALLDEPFVGTSPIVRERAVATIETLTAAGAAVVITGHEVDWVLPASDRVLWVREGTTELLGRREEAWGHERFRERYLGRRGTDPPQHGPGHREAPRA